MLEARATHRRRQVLLKKLEKVLTHVTLLFGNLLLVDCVGKHVECEDIATRQNGPHVVQLGVSL